MFALLISTALVAASPRVACPGATTGSGVVVGVKDGFAFVLTAAHVAKFDGIEVQFFPSPDPKASWFAASPEVVKRWPEPDLSLVKFRVGTQPVTVLPLAAAGKRPKAFPVAAAAVGKDAAAAGIDGATPTVWADEILAKRFVRKSPESAAFFWETRRPPDLGRSGGPLVVGGRVIGICAANSGGHGFYTHTDEIHAALTRDGFGWLVPRE
jgi:S1-C subfamily serine protease